ncbi:holo-ACP synthase [Desulfovibrio sp. OttesenSCG-928-G15]|nr:holo-ACP synthase [Desulfovibrio sp. OttesenSCG-928-G15]
MIVGLGMDLVEITRIQRSLSRFGDHFLQKILHPSECEALDLTHPFDPSAASNAAARVAARFAAKEAASKALGTGFSQGIGLHDIRIYSEQSGKPRLELFGKAREQAEKLGATQILLTLTHSRDTAGAVVILER